MVLSLLSYELTDDTAQGRHLNTETLKSGVSMAILGVLLVGTIMLRRTFSSDNINWV